ncbi:MAG: amino acid--tRNA ligase-related protein, partial [Candidatus Woesearchaeota archaeon]
DERHLIEFPLFEIEVAHCGLENLKEEISNIFRAMIENVEKTCHDEIEFLLGSAVHLELLKPPYNSMTYRDAVMALSAYNLKFGDDLKSVHEQELVKQNKGKPLFITHFPQHIKFFNMRLNREDNTIVNSMDLIMPYSGEAVGAAEREEDYNILRKRLEESDMLRLLKDAVKKESRFTGKSSDEIHKEAMSRFDWYVDIIKNKPISHAGCGIGINRVCQAILNTDDIRHATAFPLNRETLF